MFPNRRQNIQVIPVGRPLEQKASAIQLAMPSHNCSLLSNCPLHPLHTLAMTAMTTMMAVSPPGIFPPGPSHPLLSVGYFPPFSTIATTHILCHFSYNRRRSKAPLKYPHLFTHVAQHPPP